MAVAVGVPLVVPLDLAVEGPVLRLELLALGRQILVAVVVEVTLVPLRLALAVPA